MRWRRTCAPLWFAPMRTLTRCRPRPPRPPSRSSNATDEQVLTTIAACGDVNRIVMWNPNPYQSKVHAAALELARNISNHLELRTGAYREIWLDGEKIAGGEPDVVEPIYGKTYLPR